MSSTSVGECGVSATRAAGGMPTKLARRDERSKDSMDISIEGSSVSPYTTAADEQYLD